MYLMLCKKCLKVKRLNFVNAVDVNGDSFEVFLCSNSYERALIGVDPKKGPPYGCPYVLEHVMKEQKLDD